MYPNLRVFTRSLGVLLLVGLAALPRPARSETINCTAITAVPFTITAPGIYCLTQDIATNLASGNAIEIQANNVVLDLNGHRIGNMAAGAGTFAKGIYALSRQDITIKSGTVRGFLFGIVLDDFSPYTASQGNVVEDIRADHNTFYGILVVGQGNIIRNTQVVATGGTTAFGANANAFGIEVVGPEPRVLDNGVLDTFATGTGVASYGIYFNSASDGLAVNNRISDSQIGISYTTSSTGKYRDNLTSGVTTPFSGGTDAGNNH